MRDVAITNSTYICEFYYCKLRATMATDNYVHQNMCNFKRDRQSYTYIDKRVNLNVNTIFPNYVISLKVYGHGLGIG